MMLTYSIDKKSGEPVYQYLYKMIKKDIADGKIPAGSKLPSKRALAEHLGISVITVESAYRLLSDEGYTASKERSGFYVLGLEPMTSFSAGRDFYKKPGEKLADEPDMNIKIDFPFSSYSKIMRSVISEYGEKLLLKPPHNGCEILRKAVSDYLLRYRGMEAPPDRIVIGSGAEYLYGMIVQLLGRDIVYAVEDPSYEKIKKVYNACGAEYESLKLDERGISAESLENTKAKVLHVTPFKSYPTGITVSASKRFEYLKWAEKNGGFIIEDDFASEFSVNSKPVETIYSMDKDGRVIYVNTFSKSLAPSMRMGYMILPEQLAERYKERLGFYSCSVPVFDQYVLAEFINSGCFERHLNRMRRKIRQLKKIY